MRITPGGRGTAAPTPGNSRGLLAYDRPDAINPSVERGHDADAGALCARHQIGVSEIEALHLVQFDGPLKQRAVNDADGTERKDGPQRLGDLKTADLVSTTP